MTKAPRAINHGVRVRNHPQNFSSSQARIEHILRLYEGISAPPPEMEKE